MSTNFTQKELAILKIVQNDIPDSDTPYADIAKEVGLNEIDVLNLLQSLRDNGTIRRFGASIKHQKTIWSHNAMVAWLIDDSLIDSCGEIAAKHDNISHCYHRPTSSKDWPYTLYTMIHGRCKDDIMNTIEELKKTTELDHYEILESIQEMKKTSMTYFK